MKKFILLLFLILNLPVFASDNSIVFLNTKSKIYHNEYCHKLHKCTKNCIKTTKQKAIESGARPCKICGG